MDFNPQGYTPDGMAIFGKDGDLLVRFFRHAELSQAKSVKASAPIHDDVDMIEVITPGEKDPVRVVATAMHKRRFAKQWEAYQAGKSSEHQSGTPIEMLFPDQPSTVLRLKHMNVFTIQQLAGLSDGTKQLVGMGAQQWQDKARAYLNKATEGQNFHQMEQMQKQIEQLQAALAERNAAGAEPVIEEKRGPGRPRKDQAA